jgi:DNA-directed RNA polymerase specialized sigma24 family protein
MRSQPHASTHPDGHHSDQSSGVRPRDPFTTFVDKESARTLRRLMKLGISRADAWDHLQNGLLYTWLHHKDAVPEDWPKRLRSAIWNGTAMERRAYARAKKHEPKLAFEAHNDTAESEVHAPPEFVVGAREVDAQLQAAIDALPAEQRIVARLHFLYDLELNEVAQVIGGEPGKVRENLPFVDEAEIEAIAAAPSCGLETIKKRWRLARRKVRAVVQRTRKQEERITDGFVSYAILLWLWRQRGGLIRQGICSTLTVAATALLVAGHATAGAGALAALRAEVASASPSEISALAAVARGIVEQGETGVSGSVGPQGEPRTEIAEPSVRVRKAAQLSPPSRRVAGAPGASASLGRGQRSARELDTARGFLGTAAAALRAGNRAAGRGALEAYRLYFPDNPYPQQYRELAAAIDHLDDGPTIP